MPEVKKRDDEDHKITLPIADVTLDVGLGPKSSVQ
jgi:hypothetical protein